MKERSLLYFITAVLVSVIFLISLLIRTQLWFNAFASNQADMQAMPQTLKLLLPLMLIWVGWYFNNRHFLLASTILMTVLFMFHLNHGIIVTDTLFIPIDHAPAIRTTYVISFVLILASVGLGYYSHFLLGCCKDHECCQECECEETKEK
ncbi:MAG: hypothetical protein EA375_04620 [Acholeplasmataceae bacterium]|nr:MAG: hypothetical protein EA375_04620 [Acholeplasmataceae bacterium]